MFTRKKDLTDFARSHILLGKNLSGFLSIEPKRPSRLPKRMVSGEASLPNSLLQEGFIAIKSSCQAGFSPKSIIDIITHFELPCKVKC